MSPLWFGQSARLAAQDDLRPGNRDRRPLGARFRPIATVLELRPDLVGIPHARFIVTVDRPARAQLVDNAQVLALQSFLETYFRAIQGPGIG
jgi:hypothetical protein